jgi:lysophospholipase L1-like esterase
VGHVHLLGDSIFDNASYVAKQRSVLEQVRQALPAGWKATLGAVDGASVVDVRAQLGRLDQSATHLFVSAGGNDALNSSGVLGNAVRTVAEAADRLAAIQSRFRKGYQELLGELKALGKPLTICTIYDAIPGLGKAERTALAVFNDVILRSAFQARVAVIDLRLVCDESRDYSDISPIEPSATGGAKIARLIAQVAANHDFSVRHSSVLW